MQYFGGALPEVEIQWENTGARAQKTAPELARGRETRLILDIRVVYLGVAD